LNSGSYRVFFNTKNVNYQPQWYNAKDTFSSADPVAVIADQETTGIDGTLFTGGSIAGRVTDGSGDGVVGVYVRAYDADLERGVYRSSSTDADGYYEIIGLPGGDYRVSFDAYGINYWPEDYGLSGDFNFKNEWFNDQDKFPAADTVAVFPGQQTAEVNAVLTPGGAIRGTMLGYNSYPFVFCAFENNNWRDNFGYDRYAINGDWPYGENIYMIKGLPTGSYYVLFDSDVSFIPDAYYNNVQFIDDATKVAVTAGSITDNINMMSFPCGRLQGKITNAAGSGIANVGINFIDAATNRNGRSAVTDANGDYVRTNWSGNWKIYFDTSNVTQGQYESGYYNGKSSLDAADSLNVAPGADITGIDAVLEPGGGMISGFVYNSEGIGVANAAVELYQAQSKCWLAFKATQATGYYEFAGLIPGEYKIEVIPRNQEAVEWYSDKGSYAEATPVVAVQGQNTSCSITLGMTDPLVQSLTLVSPHGGESLIIGSTYEITWNDVGVDTLALLTLCQEGKAAQIIAMVDPLAKSYTWTVGTYSGGIAEKGGGYYIKIETADALFSSTSDGTFYLENSALTLNTPNGGESWELGTTQSISWLQSGLTGDITIDLYKAGSFYRRIGTAAVEAGSYSWTIPTDLTAASDFSVKIYQGSVEDMSNEYFSLAGQVVDPGDSVRDDIVGKMIYISAGSFSQGSPAAEVGRETDESQFVHRLSRNLWVMETEISRAMWSELKDLQPSLPDDPSDLNYGTGLTNPVQQVTWQQAVLFANLLSVQNGLARCYFTDAAFTTPIDASNYSGGPFYCNFNATGYRLPTEGEWEYFARAGTNTPFSITEPNYNITTSESCTQGALTSLENAAWFCANAGSQTLAVGTKSVNPWNLHDVHGNVWEWCWDYFGSYPTSSQTDYAGAPTGTERALRGGGFGNYSKTARSAKRSSEKETTGEWAVGFRLVRSIPKINSYLNVTSPNGASFWEKGKTYSITWLTQGGQNANVKIYLYKGTSTLVKTITTLTANDGSYDWLVPTALVTGSTYFIRVKTADNLFWDDSDKFSIIVPSISVIAPAAGTIWTHNATKTITWNKIGTQHANVKIQLYQGLTKKLDITLSTDNDGFYDWTVPATLAKVSTYSIRITTLDGKVIGKSGKFTITNGYIRVTAPVTGAKWIRGTSQAITWQYEGAAVNANVKIQLYKGIVKVLDISLSSPTASGTFTWDIPAELALATNYAVQVTALDNLVTGKTGNFAIVPGIITVTQPAAGTIWQRGLAHTITWSNEGTLNANVKVQLLKGTLVVATMAATTSNDGSFDWTIPAAQALAATYKVRITTVDGLVKGESGVFTISSSVGLTLLSPNGGEILEPNETKAIRWSDDPDVLEVKLEFSRDNGGSFTTIADHVPDTGSYDWLVPVNFTRNGIVRVSDSSGKLWRENSLLEYSFKFIYNGTGEEPGAVFWFGGSDPQAPGYGFARIEIGSAKVQFGGIAKTIEPLAADWHELRVRFDFRRDTVEIHLDDQMLFANAALNTTREHYFQPYLVLQSGGEAPLDFTLDDLAVNVVQLDSVGEDRQLFNVLCENFDRYDKRVNGLQNCWHWQNTKDSETKVELKIENLSDKSMRMLTEGGKQLMIYLPFLLPDKVPFDISDKNMVIENQ
jgi:formylglycine-generating enzyme required for sulfatase activity/protocatechuate 3,4-dioxygenase beta subunit